MIDLNQARAVAEVLIAQAQQPPSDEPYRQVIDDNPRDWNTINKIGESEFAAKNPAKAEFAAGRQLDPAFEEFLELAGRTECVMDEASAVGL